MAEMNLKELSDFLRAELEEHRQAVRKVADMIEAMEKPQVMSELPQVRYRSQWDADATYVKSDCGPACLAMLLEFRSIHVSIDDISKACGMGPNKKHSTTADLIGVAKKFALALEAVSGWTLEQFAARTPCIVLVHYGTFQDRLDQGYIGSHWVVLLGVRDNTVVFHDPDWWEPRRLEGASRHVDTVRFALAMHDCIRDGNSSGTGLVMSGTSHL